MSSILHMVNRWFVAASIAIPLNSVKSAFIISNFLHFDLLSKSSYLPPALQTATVWIFATRRPKQKQYLSRHTFSLAVKTAASHIRRSVCESCFCSGLQLADEAQSGRQQVFWSLPPIWEARAEALDSGFDLIQPQLLQVFGSQTSGWEW